MNTIENKIKSSIYSAIVGDALGVPFEFSTRQEMALCSVKNMLGYGRYDQPAGTWSDDTSMILATMDALKDGIDYNNIMEKFCNWLYNSAYTAHDYVFDIGITTFKALDNYKNMNLPPLECGATTEDDNGNGSLMRILPAAIYLHDTENTEEFLNKIHNISKLTHAHPRALIGCGIYALIVRELLTKNDITKEEAVKNASSIAEDFYSQKPFFQDELPHYMKILNYEIPELEENEIYSSGYVVHTLESSLWCFLRNDNTKDILLSAVNLGLDTDTTGTVAGGIAGLYYGIDSIPDEWLNMLAKKDMLEKMIEEFIQTVNSKKDSE